MPAENLAAADPFTQAQAQFAKMQSDLLSEEAGSMTHSDIEEMLETGGRELLRLLFQGYLDTRSPGEATGPVRDAQGTERSSARLHERTLGTIFGPVQSRRMGYGAKGLASLHPLDGELNLPPERYSHGLRRRAAQEAAKGSFDEALETLAEYSGTKVPKRQLEELVQRAASDFDAFYDQRSVSSEETKGSLLILSFDGKGVVMLKKDLREATRKAAQKRKHKLKRRLAKGEKRHAKRMATVATVYTIAPFIRSPEQVARGLAPIHEVNKAKRPRPHSKRVWASLEKRPEQVIAQAFQEAHERDPRQEKTWFALVDGNQSQLKIIPRLAKKYHDVELTVVLDIIHVTEYLWKASIAFHDEDSRKREEWVSHRLLEILRGHSSRVAGGIRRSATLRGLSVVEREAVDECCDYLIKHASYLRYDQYLAAGAPIATGVIEGACRHLVRDRMELTGARWSLAGAEAVLRLRALRSSGDFDEYWRFHETREYQRNHAAHYANREVPGTGKIRSQEYKPRLKLVK